MKPRFDYQKAAQELMDLTWAVVAINGWNRIAISFRSVTGTYNPTKKPGESV